MSMGLKVSRIVEKKNEEELKTKAKERKEQSDWILENVYEGLMRSFRKKKGLKEQE